MNRLSVVGEAVVGEAAKRLSVVGERFVGALPTHWLTALPTHPPTLSELPPSLKLRRDKTARQAVPLTHCFS